MSKECGENVSVYPDFGVGLSEFLGRAPVRNNYLIINFFCL